MMDIGFYLTGINNETNLPILDHINQFIDMNPYYNVVLFNDQYNRLNLNNKFYTLHINKAKFFDGILFFFNITDASIICSFPSPKNKIFIVNDIYWQTHKNIVYGQWNKIFNDPKITTVTTNTQLYDIYSLCWRKPLCSIAHLSAETIKDVVQKLQ